MTASGGARVRLPPAAAWLVVAVAGCAAPATPSDQASGARASGPAALVAADVAADVTADDPADIAAAAARAQPAPCPAAVPSSARCWTGDDGRGATVWLAVPEGWSGTLVVHAHGGPELGSPRPERAAADLQRWSIWPRAGFAYAGSGFRRGGVAVVSAADDTERVRRIFVARVGPPKRTVLHGQSWGAGVAAKAAERRDATRPYDAVLLTSGVLGGGAASYDFRLDLRVVYQAVCGDHPRADEPAYPLWQGLPPGSTLTRAELARRVDACTGADRAAAERSAEQARRLAAIVDVVRIPERSLTSHLAWATWHFQDIAFARLGGRNAFGNEGVRYVGQSGDTSLDARVARYAVDARARADFDRDAGLSGRIGVPVLTLHAIDDPTAAVELESTFRDLMTRGGSAARLVQAYTDEHEHSYLADAEYVAAIGELLDWVETGRRPTPESIAMRCARVDAAFVPERGCRIRPAYAPRPLAARVPPR